MAEIGIPRENREDMRNWVSGVTESRFRGNQAAWAHKAGLTRQTINSFAVSGTTSISTLVKLIEAAGEDTEVVLRLAGWLPQKKSQDHEFVAQGKDEITLLKRFRSSDPHDRRLLLELAGSLLRNTAPSE